jgi:hypothetical protein
MHTNFSRTSYKEENTLENKMKMGRKYLIDIFKCMDVRVTKITSSSSDHWIY